ncbi:MAG: type II toxin-antitoxin system prevent-host-death family antitoxin [Gammaproteobacteria bacterium]|nr:type II toxin-antitoxin system prevent-host-death family antitoxin [Gammaproteobacteria bacterium]
MIINLSEAKTHLSELVQLAYQGEEIIIAKNNLPLVELVAYHPKSKVILGLFENHPERDALNDALAIDISDLWEDSEILS